MDLRRMRLADLTGNPRNPRVGLLPADPEWGQIDRSIDEWGQVEPLVWNSRTGLLVSGHQRATILEHRGETAAWVSVVDLDPDQELALGIALNQPGGIWDETRLAAVLADIEPSGLLDTTGVDPATIERLLATPDIDPTDPEPGERPDRRRDINEHECGECGHRWCE